MKLVITTQIRENYGAHDWDGVGPCPQYWKNKGGEVYVIENLSSAAVNKITSGGIPHLKSLIETHNVGFEESVLAWDFLNDSEELPVDEWENPWYLTYQNKKWVALKIKNNNEYSTFNHRKDIVNKVEMYEMAFGGEQENYQVVFNNIKGEQLDWQGNLIKEVA